MPILCSVANQETKFINVFGNDYNTLDGSAIRDFIHVVDLAKGHLKALENIKFGVNIYNLGTGRGTSVYQIIELLKKINNVKINYKVAPRREGDIPVSYADCTKAKLELKWKRELSLSDMVKDAWRFELKKII